MFKRSAPPPPPPAVGWTAAQLEAVRESGSLEARLTSLDRGYASDGEPLVSYSSMGKLAAWPDTWVHLNFDYDLADRAPFGTLILRDSKPDGKPVAEVNLTQEVAVEVRDAFTFAALAGQKELRLVIYLDKTPTKDPNVIGITSIWANTELDLTER